LYQHDLITDVVVVFIVVVFIVVVVVAIFCYLERRALHVNVIASLGRFTARSLSKAIADYNKCHSIRRRLLR